MRSNKVSTSVSSTHLDPILIPFFLGAVSQPPFFCSLLKFPNMITTTPVQTFLFIAFVSIFAASPCYGQCDGDSCPIPRPIPAPPFPSSLSGIDLSPNRSPSELPTCGAAYTELGLVTALHCRPGARFRMYPKSDLAVDPDFRDPHKKAWPVSNEAPRWYVGRRGGKFPVFVIEERELFWVTQSIFYSGESGRPLFDKDGKVCGIVSGNVLINGRWRGHVSRLSIVNFGDADADSLIRTEPDPALQQDSPIWTIPDSGIFRRFRRR